MKLHKGFHIWQSSDVNMARDILLISSSYLISTVCFRESNSLEYYEKDNIKRQFVVLLVGSL